MLTGSNKCDQGGFDTPSSLGPPKVWGMGLDRGVWSQQFPGQPLSRVNYYTNQMPPPVMVGALMIHASFAHLAFFTLTWVLSCGASETLCRFAPRALILRSVTFCSVADRTVIIWDNRAKEEKKKRQNMSVIFFLLVSCRVSNSNVHNCIICSVCTFLWVQHLGNYCVYFLTSAARHEYRIVGCKYVHFVKAMKS